MTVPFYSTLFTNRITPFSMLLCSNSAISIMRCLALASVKPSLLKASTKSLNLIECWPFSIAFVVSVKYTVLASFIDLFLPCVIAHTHIHGKLLKKFYYEKNPPTTPRCKKDMTLPPHPYTQKSVFSTCYHDLSNS